MNFCVKVAFDVCANYGYGQAVRLLSRFCFLLDSSKDYKPKGHACYGTIMISLMNGLTAEFV